ncbi:MAG TPA: DNA-binding domain-containing protein [Pirellulaceae bacterium]
MQRLDKLQQWFLNAVAASTSTAAAEAHLLPSSQQSASERLDIYRTAYTARLLEVLLNLFPCTRFAIGDELFAQFAAGYLQAHPPNSYTLARLADHFADYLEATRPVDWGAFVVELVLLEEGIDRVFDAPGPERLPVFSLAAAADDSLCLKLAPGLELHRFDFPVSDYYTAWKQQREPSWPNAGEQFIALLRRDYIVRRYDLSEGQHALLLRLQAGDSLGSAVSAAATQATGDLVSLAVQYQTWFQFWAREGFFVDLEFGPIRAGELH